MTCPMVTDVRCHSIASTWLRSLLCRTRDITSGSVLSINVFFVFEMRIWEGVTWGGPSQVK